MYTHQKLQVKWNNTKSDKFSVTNGVRQGGVLSPYLFSFYMDELLVKLKENGVGCHIILPIVLLVPSDMPMILYYYVLLWKVYVI